MKTKGREKGFLFGGIAVERVRIRIETAVDTQHQQHPVE